MGIRPDFASYQNTWFWVILLVETVGNMRSIWVFSFLLLGCSSPSPASPEGEAAPETSVTGYFRLEDYEPDHLHEFFRINPAVSTKSTALPAPRDTSTSAVHLVSEVDSSASDYTNHHHFGGQGSQYSALTFWARADSAQDLIVSHVEPDAGLDFWASEAAGDPWPSTRITLTAEWQEFSLPFDAMLEDSGSRYAITGAGALDGFSIHFLTPQAAPFDYWLDDISYACTEPSASCDSTTP
jgi:hypothetical protein